MEPLWLPNYLVVGAVLFALGLIGFLTRRNLIVMFLCAEMMLQGVALNLVAFAAPLGQPARPVVRRSSCWRWRPARRPSPWP